VDGVACGDVDSSGIFVIIAARPYFLRDGDSLAHHQGKQTWLPVHITFGTAALLIEPFNFSSDSISRSLSFIVGWEWCI